MQAISFHKIWNDNGLGSIFVCVTFLGELMYIYSRLKWDTEPKHNLY